MKKKIFIIIFCTFAFTQNVFSFSADPKEFISEIVSEAKKILIETNSKEFKTKGLSELALKTVDIKGLAYYTLGGKRKEISTEELKKYEILFEK